MVSNCRSDLCQESIGQGRDCANTFVQNYFFNSMEREKDSRGLDAALFTVRDVVHPIVKCVQIDTPHRHTGCTDIQQAPEETLSWGLQIDDNDRIQLHGASKLSCVEHGGVGPNPLLEKRGGTTRTPPDQNSIR